MHWFERPRASPPPPAGPVRLAECLVPPAPPAAWLVRARLALAKVPLVPRDQVQAALRLLEGLEFDTLSDPVVWPSMTWLPTAPEAPGQSAVALDWSRPDVLRSAIVVPFDLAGRFRAEVWLYDRGGLLWHGWPRCPVIFTRGVLSWIYPETEGRVR